MSVWGCVGKMGSSYMKHLDPNLLMRMTSSARKSRGAYGAASAFNKWARGYTRGRKSTFADVATRRGTIWGAGAVGASVVGGIFDRDRRRARARNAAMGPY